MCIVIETKICVFKLTSLLTCSTSVASHDHLPLLGGNLDVFGTKHEFFLGHLLNLYLFVFVWLGTIDALFGLHGHILATTTCCPKRHHL